MTGTAQSGDFYIAGALTADDWRARKVALAAGGSAIWDSAFTDFFKTRLELRYLHPIKLLQDHGTFSGEGFSITAIQCTLIEFIAATRYGLNYRFVVPGAPPLGAHEYAKSGALFRDFLAAELPFSAEFTAAVAQDFYASVRCGLLHEASTKNGWRIWARGSSIIDAANKMVYRDNLQAAILDYVRLYGIALRTDANLQAAFIRKFDSLAS
ncbi:hypothetical protein [Mesorhizobium sp. M00.F.Ca.ET.217.01.1.1]|uniref:hypothetical protein n=1 Tax=Mesorhizobium sp. M00.F.Ca.ET.217.01.1.1 TaxID=2500529 RepID=UPI000FD746FF|nr:hypothetical protein [Mesorhizobium sp. M00.F.Ca.ET.217.01.1.1]TGQ13585.1 hypothetical protein EN860_030605 [Mesorhizobium sp. M00.F.Ca.ET.217.01.1.1]TGV85449.1 hypothetical protein EN801_029310 [Mesorhizobium sp. M00.F.Ca.ET.158.01.1.1]